MGVLLQPVRHKNAQSAGWRARLQLASSVGNRQWIRSRHAPYREQALADSPVRRHLRHTSDVTPQSRKRPANAEVAIIAIIPSARLFRVEIRRGPEFGGFGHGRGFTLGI